MRQREFCSCGSSEAILLKLAEAVVGGGKGVTDKARRGGETTYPCGSREVDEIKQRQGMAWCMKEVRERIR